MHLLTSSKEYPDGTEWTIQKTTSLWRNWCEVILKFKWWYPELTHIENRIDSTIKALDTTTQLLRYMVEYKNQMTQMSDQITIRLRIWAEVIFGLYPLALPCSLLVNSNTYTSCALVPWGVKASVYRLEPSAFLCPYSHSWHHCMHHTWSLLDIEFALRYWLAIKLDCS